VDREREIESFKPEKFWNVYARFAREGVSYDGVWFKDRQNRLKEREAAERIAEKVGGGVGTVRKAEEKTATEKPPLLYDLTELQRNANARYGFTAERTLRAAQALYEERKLITYPRTSSRYLSKDMVGTLKKRVEATGGLAELAPFATELLALDRLPTNKRIVDDAKVTDHHAIVPTNKKTSGNLPPDEARIYDLVARRFLAVFFPPARFENTTVVTVVEGETFLSRGRVVLEAGWRRLYLDGVGGKKEKVPPVLPPIEKGQEWTVSKVAVKEGETKPPPRYSESALLGAMETAGKFVEDEELRQAMKESGLGTPATRAATIERLVKVGYLVREKKTLVPTEKGRALIRLLGESPLSSPELTARWEERLARMEKGAGSRKDFMMDIEDFASALVEEVRNKEGERVVGGLPEVRFSSYGDEEVLRLLGLEVGLQIRYLEDRLGQANKRRAGQTTLDEGPYGTAQGLQEQGREALLRRARPRRRAQGAAGIRRAELVLSTGCAATPTDADY
jgi:DNA topoisomerase-3